MSQKYGEFKSLGKEILNPLKTFLLRQNKHMISTFCNARLMC